jgi:hypothetical protein
MTSRYRQPDIPAHSAPIIDNAQVIQLLQLLWAQVNRRCGIFGNLFTQSLFPAFCVTPCIGTRENNRLSKFIFRQRLRSVHSSFRHPSTHLEFA